jgi:hypothetical protein
MFKKKFTPNSAHPFSFYLPLLSNSLRIFLLVVGLFFSLSQLARALTPDQQRDYLKRYQEMHQNPTPPAGTVTDQGTSSQEVATFTPPKLLEPNFIPITIDGQQLEVMDRPVSVNDWCAYANTLGGNGSPYLGIAATTLVGKIYKDASNNRHNLIKMVPVKKEDGSEEYYFVPEEGIVDTPLGKIEIKDLPITGTSLYDASCFCNWYNHGCLSGNEGLASIASGPYQIVETPSYSTNDGKGGHGLHPASKKVNLINPNATYRLPHYEELSTFFEKNPNNVGPNIKELSDTETPAPSTQIGSFTTYKVVSAGESASSGFNPTTPIHQQHQNPIQVGKNRPVPPTEHTIDTGFRLVKVSH